MIESRGKKILLTFSTVLFAWWRVVADGKVKKRKEKKITKMRNIIVRNRQERVLSRKINYETTECLVPDPFSTADRLPGTIARPGTGRERREGRVYNIRVLRGTAGVKKKME